MISQGEIKRKYNRLMASVATDQFYKTDLTNRVNCYICPDCKHITKTKDVDAGVTPFIFDCDRCSGNATSTFFKDIAPNKQPTFEWYRPTLKQLFKMKKNINLLDHILNGGLDHRKIVSETT